MTTLDDLYAEIRHDNDYGADVEYTPTRLPAKVNQEYETFLERVSEYLPEVEFCRDCGEPMHVYKQSCVRGKPPVTLAECKNAYCDLLDVTLSARKWSTITESELDAYRAVVRSMKAVSA